MLGTERCITVDGTALRRVPIFEFTATIGGSMARRPNYGFEKRQKEIEKQKKKEEKAAKKEQRKLEAAAGEGEILQGDEDLEGGDDDGDEE
jgi:hypothetical protein